VKILLILFRSLGDVCMGTTVLRAVRVKYPTAQIDFMTEKANINTLEGNPDINNIIIGSNYYEALDVFSTNGYDEIYKLNMINHTETSWHHIPELKNQHLVEWYGKKAEVDVSGDDNIYIYPSEKDEKVVDAVLAEIIGDLTNKKLVAIHTSSGQYNGKDKKYRIESKDWSINYFDITAERLCRNGYTVIQIGASSDRKMEYKDVVDLTGKMSFKQTACLLKKCVLYLGVDSGPAYLAGWAGLPALILMGATQFVKNGGPSVGPRQSNVEYINAPKPNDKNCSPSPCYINCVIQKLGGCIADISTDSVWDKIKSMIGANNE